MELGDAPARERLRVPRAGRKQDEVRRRCEAHHEHPAAVRRDRERGPLSEQDRGRAIRPADVGGVLEPGALALLSEEEGLAVCGELGRPAPVQPREVTVLRLAGRPPDEPKAQTTRAMWTWSDREASQTAISARPPERA